MNIETMSVNVEDRSISINGEGYICAAEYFPYVVSNIISLQWHPGRQGRCKGSISRHVGGGEGLDEFTLLEPFVKPWEEAKERKLARAAMEQAEAVGDFDAPRDPAEAEDNVVDLPRFLQSPQPVQEPSIAPEMLERLVDFTQRSSAVVEEARQSIEDSRTDRARIAALESELTDVKDRLNQLIASVAKVVGHMDGGGR